MFLVWLMTGTFYVGECLHPVASGCCWTGGGAYMHKTDAAESTPVISSPNRARCGGGKWSYPGQVLAWRPLLYTISINSEEATWPTLSLTFSLNIIIHEISSFEQQQQKKNLCPEGCSVSTIAAFRS